MLVGYVILVVAFIFGIVLHELIHGLCFAFFCKKGFKSIRFGIRKNPLVFYTHCAEPLKRIPFWIGTLAPCAILGIIPTLIGQTIGSLGLIVFGFLFTAFSVGDIYLVWEAGVLKKTDVVLDDPENIGFMIVDSEKELDF
ncbi:MAG: DUF3267 domain-containing protein [Flammeovirgaceae bacterium]|jgi:hypothetical protein|nr:DUF3267 domain-containing protein [Flammeovirgaceae bacterium]MBP9926045.1 DUF3267 domain-containing protein [Cyclobacteriaceae bacterium]